tara:strand:- start:50 stop:505 length:456 start_codon:yes stop_codon:yes gene_type:complete
VSRKPRPEDFEQIHALGQWMQENSHFANNGWCSRKVYRIVSASQDSDSNIFLRVVERNNKIIGFMVGSVSEYFFSDKLIAQDMVLVFHPNERENILRHIIKLIKDFEAWAKEKGAVEVAIGITSGIAGEGYPKLLNRLGYDQVGILTKKEV